MRREEEFEDAVNVCPFCGNAHCSCCPNCGSPIDYNSSEPRCEVCGWVQEW